MAKVLGTSSTGKKIGLLCTMGLALMAGACAQIEEPGETSLTQPMTEKAPAVASKSAQGSKKMAMAPTRAQLEQANAHAAEAYQSATKEIKPLLTYARSLKALGKKQEAFDLLQSAEVYHNGNAEYASEYGRAALEVDQLPLADKLLTFADTQREPDWRVVSARGTLLAKQGQYNASIPMFERALKLNPGQPSILNNLAMAHAAAGESGKAESFLRQAGAETSDDVRIRQNLVLVLGANGKTAEASRLAGLTPGEAQATQPQMAPVSVAQAQTPTAPQAAPGKAKVEPQAVASAGALPPAAKIAKVAAKSAPATATPAKPADADQAADALIAQAKAQDAAFRQSLAPSQTLPRDQASLTSK